MTFFSEITEQLLFKVQCVLRMEKVARNLRGNDVVSEMVIGAERIKSLKTQC